MNKTIIIAEAGVNHNGDISLAKKLIKIAADSGADYVKFQTFKAEKLATKSANQAKYQQANIGYKQTQLEMLKILELQDTDHKVLIEECKINNIGFLSSAFDVDGINFLKSLNIDYLKIPSGEITNLPYLKVAAKFGKPIILSTGMACIEEIDSALEILLLNGCTRDNIYILHCITEYPAPKELVNLNFINTLKNKFGVNVGYSDHTLGIEIAIAAVAIGAKIIEKHFTIDKRMSGPDHKASLDAKELKEMVNCIRSVEKALGNGNKEISTSEKNNAKVVRKSLIAAKNIKKNELFTYENLDSKRPGTGISPMNIDKYIGCYSNKNYEKDELIEDIYE